MGKKTEAPDKWLWVDAFGSSRPPKPRQRLLKSELLAQKQN